jgi:hypothetical protein
MTIPTCLLHSSLLVLYTEAVCHCEYWTGNYITPKPQQCALLSYEDLREVVAEFDEKEGYSCVSTLDGTTSVNIRPVLKLCDH